MHYTGTVYRPPFEKNTKLLQVTTGCSHNGCKFCMSYRGAPFGVEPMGQIEEDLAEIRERRPKAKRIFLLHGDAFALDFPLLREICGKIRAYLPMVETISMFAHVQNIASKSRDELRALRALGVGDLYVGVESGFDPALAYMNKGQTAFKALSQCLRLEEAQIPYHAMYLTGLAGKGGGEQNALYTAALFSKLHPYAISCQSLTLFEDAPLWGEVLKGRFVEADELERLTELYTFLKNVNCHTMFYALHVTNSLPFSGRLPEEREQMLALLDHAIRHYDELKFDRASCGM